MKRQCQQARAQFPATMDGKFSHDAGALARHLEGCEPCRRDLASWRAVQRGLNALRPVAAPADLALRLRIAASHARAGASRGWFANWDMVWQNTVRPLALQCSAGLASALALLALVAVLVGVFAAPPQRVQASSTPDEPLGLPLAPHYLYSIVPSGPIVAGSNAPIVVEVFLGADGRVYDYKILSGEDSPGVRAQLNSALYFTVFAPARVLGRPVAGHAVMSFAAVKVRG